MGKRTPKQMCWNIKSLLKFRMVRKEEKICPGKGVMTTKSVAETTETAGYFLSGATGLPGDNCLLTIV